MMLMLLLISPPFSRFRTQSLFPAVPFPYLEALPAANPSSPMKIILLPSRWDTI